MIDAEREALEVARTVAAIDGRLLSREAIEAFAELAARTRQEAARRCEDLAMERSRLLRDEASIYRQRGDRIIEDMCMSDAQELRLLASAIEKEFELTLTPASAANQREK
jgi:hypothetical protein